MEELMVKKALLRSSIRGLDRSSLRATLYEYEIEEETLRRMRTGIRPE
jgi:hypothetical protein